jgi:hypothetical protein
MAQLAILKGRNGGSVIVNLDNVVWADTMNTEKGPLIGFTAISFLGQQMQICVQGTPEEVYEMCERQKRTIEIAQ